MKLFKEIFVASLASASIFMSGTSSAVASDKQSTNTLVVGTYQAPRHLNGGVQSGFATGLVSTQLFASLLRFDDEWNALPYLADSWEWSDDNLSLTLSLRSDAVFHDNTPVTSEDVAFSIMAIKENHPFQSMLSAVEKVETPETYKVIIRLSKPHPALLIALSPALTPIMPKHIYDDGQDLKSHPKNSEGLIGSGPYKLDRFVPGKEVVLSRFDKFFREGKPILDRIVYQINPDTMTLLMGLERGDIQMVPFMNEPAQLRRAASDENISVLDRGYEGAGALNWIAFNMAKKPFDDVRVRKAISHLIDKEFIVKTLTAGFAKPSNGPIVEKSPYAAPNVDAYPLDLAEAERLLDEAGLERKRNNERFSLTLDHMPGQDALSKNVAEYVRAQLKKVGITATIRTSADLPSWMARIANHDFDMTTDNVWNWGDPVIGVHRTYLSSNIRPIIWTNTQSYANERVDQLLEQAAVETDLEKRKDLYAEFHNKVIEDIPIIFLAHSPFHTLLSKQISNPPTTIWGALSPLDEVSLK